VTRPTATDPTLAPPGRDLLYILAPAPNTEVGKVNWDATSPAYVEQMLGVVAARLPQLRDGAEVLSVVTPSDWARQVWQRAPRSRWRTTSARPARSAGQHRARRGQCGSRRFIDGARVGVPTAVISGRLAADRITGVSARQEREVQRDDRIRTRRRRRS